MKTLLTACLLSLALFSSASAWAHAYLVKAVPAQRAAVFAAPKRVELWFNERLEPRFCRVTVADAAGNIVDRADMQLAANNPKQLTVGLKPLAPGVYSVKYRVLSVDGHAVEDRFTFSVRERR